MGEHEAPLYVAGQYPEMAGTKIVFLTVTSGQRGN